MRIVFLGTSEFAIPSLKSLARAQRHHISYVITQPDSPQGRGLKILPPPIKLEALRLGIPVLQTSSISSISAKEIVQESGADVIYCVAYGEFLPQAMLESLPYGAVNLHPSKLPFYRGAAPVQRALMDGCAETAVTFIRMAREMDAGDILLQKPLKIHPEETAAELLQRAADLGGELLPGLIDDLEKGKTVPVHQDSSKATFAPAVKKEEGLIDWGCPAVQIFNLWRGLTPKPGVYSFLESKRFIFGKLRLPEAISQEAVTGTIKTESNRTFIAAGDGRTIEVLEIKPEGKGTLSSREFINGYKPDGKLFRNKP